MTLNSDSSYGSLWDQFSEDETFYLQIPDPEGGATPKPPPEDNQIPKEHDEEGLEAAYDSCMAEMPQPKNREVRAPSPELDVDSEDDISPLIAVYDEPSNVVPTQPVAMNIGSKTSSEATIVASSHTCTDKNTRKRSRVLSEPHVKDTRSVKMPRIVDINAPYFIAHSPEWQGIFDEKKLPFGVQWEIARLVSTEKLAFDDLKLEKLECLQSLGTNEKAAPMVEKIFAKDFDSIGRGAENSSRPDPFTREKESKFPYIELDREEEELNKGDPFGCLGFREGGDGWYGGKVAFRGRLKQTSSKWARAHEFKVELERPELSASFRFSRRFGSSSFLRLKIPKELWKHSASLVDFLRRPFVLCGFVYRTIWEKDKTIILQRTNESLPVSGPGPIRSSLRETFSLEEFFENHNPLGLNKNQTVAKWASRFQLGLSTSAPGLKVLNENISLISDIVSPEPDKSDMTDGSGFINQSGLRLLNHKFKWDEWPTAIQCRIAGAKGMLLQHPTDNSSEPRVWIRPSQIKIRYAQNSDDDARLIIDVLRSCHSRTQCTLGTETIINLAENGVPPESFFLLLDTGFDRLLASLTTWEGENAMFELWCALARLGGVMAARAARLKPGLARVKGHSSRDAQVDDDEDGLDEETKEMSVAWWVDEISGQPSSLEETVMSLLDSGFTPFDCSVLRDKLSIIARSQIRSYGLQYKIEVPMSVTTFIQPDPYNILEEGQVFFKSARRNLLNRDGLVTDMIVGPVLVTRHPCKLPTDVQKVSKRSGCTEFSLAEHVVEWNAIDCPQLRDMTGIIFFSTRGPRRAADYLGGGDYDGDKALLIYDPSLVDGFKNADIKFADPRNDIERDNFSKHTETVSQLLERTKPTKEQPLARMHALQEYLLGGLENMSLVGEYSNMHDYATYVLGYTHKETIRLAHMFCRTLDGAKTGLTVLKEVVADDRKKYNRVGTMHWKKSSKKSEYTSDEARAKRPKRLHPFIMDILVEYADGKARDVEQAFSTRLEEYKIHIPDRHLIAPWEEALKLADQLKAKGCNHMHEDMQKIIDHVKTMYQKHREQVKQSYSNKSKGRVSFTELRIETRQNQLRAMSKEFVALPTTSEVTTMTGGELARLRASFAYLYDSEQNKSSWTKWTRFPWDVAMRELCAIKAKALGSSKTVQGDFYSRFIMKSSSSNH
ncbi:hypothetical protein L218DRAFT_892734 [Marasmius fiardii PR-910]|nr:hypothetical protein L218DRAFT_892734 [Marasmius fiardii PR-910]